MSNRPNNGITYTGNLNNNGRLYGIEQKNGIVIYRGYFKNGKYDGTGIAYSDTGIKQYEGNFVNGHFHGEGISYINGRKWYEGNFVKGEREGKGTRYRNNGTRMYEGNWINGYISGYGTLYHSNGNTKQYEGEMDSRNVGRYGYKWGKGIEYNKSGSIIYDGNFVKGKKEGYGTSYNPNGTVNFSGLWKNNKPLQLNLYQNGPVATSNGNLLRRTLPVGSTTKKQYFRGHFNYSGKFDTNGLQGFGIKKNLKGKLVYEGNFVNSKEHGKGIKYMPNGKTIEYIGNFMYGNYHGQGKIRLNNDVYYTGLFKYGKINEKANRESLANELYHLPPDVDPNYPNGGPGYLAAALRYTNTLNRGAPSRTMRARNLRLNQLNRKNFIANYVKQKKPTSIERYYKLKKLKQVTEELSESLRNTARITRELIQ